MTIQQLRKSGHKIRVTHYRWVEFAYQEHDNSWFDLTKELVRKCDLEFLLKENIARLLPRGGKTVIEITDPNGKDFKLESKCSPLDNFCYKEGVKQCLRKKRWKETKNVTFEFEFAKIPSPSQSIFTDSIFTVHSEYNQLDEESKKNVLNSLKDWAEKELEITS